MPKNDDDAQALALTPKVTTLAKPLSNVLLAARFEVQRNEKIRLLFEEYKGYPEEESVSTLTDQATTLLMGKIEGSEAEVREAARFLADEYMQIGDSLLVISSTTGLPIAKLTEADLWTPPPTLREDGKLVPQRPRMRPELEGFLVRWHFERDRESKLAQELSSRVLTTTALVEEGDRRLAVVTRSGRAQLADELRGQLPTLLPEAAAGVARIFIQSLEFGEGPGEPFRGFTAFAYASTPIADHKTHNLKFDLMSNVRSKIANEWSRGIARTVSRLVTSAEDVSFPDYEPRGTLWVADDPDFDALHSTGPSSLFKVEGAATMVLRAPCVGHIVLRNFDLKHRVVHDRWDFAASVEYDLWLTPDLAQGLKFTNLPFRAHAAEIV